MLKINKLVLLPILCLALFLNISEAKAERIYLDEETLQKGYTFNIEEDNFLLGIDALEADDGLRVLAEKRKRKRQPIPKKYRRISKSYYYKIKGDFADSVNLAVKYNPDKARENHQKVLAYWDRQDKKWRRLDSVLDEENNYVRAQLKQKRAKVIVLESKKLAINTTDDSEAVSLYAPTALAMDEESGVVIYGKNANKQRSMASLTKMMSALIFLESGTAWDKEIIIEQQDLNYKAYSGIRLGDTVTAKNLFYGMVVASDNTAAWALARSTGMTRAEFVNKMNEKAQELGLEKTIFTDPSGIDPGNKTTAYEYALLMREVLDYSSILKASTTKEYHFQVGSGRWCRARNTNRLVRNGTSYRITGSKTGYLDEAGFCVMLKTGEGDNELLTVVMGDSSAWAVAADTDKLVKWAWDFAY